MSIYEKASFGAFINNDDGFFVDNLEIIGNPLQRNNLFDFSEVVEDWDPLTLPANFELRFLLLPSLPIEIPAQFALRPDNLCNTIYGDGDYWFFVALYNDFEDWTEFRSGRNIRIPVKGQLDTLLIDLGFLKQRRALGLT